MEKKESSAVDIRHLLPSFDTLGDSLPQKNAQNSNKLSYQNVENLPVSKILPDEIELMNPNEEIKSSGQNKSPEESLGKPELSSKHGKLTSKKKICFSNYHIGLIVAFYKNPEALSCPDFIKKMVRSKFPYINYGRHFVLDKLKKWSKLVALNEKMQLCYKFTKKVILGRESFLNVVKVYHTGGRGGVHRSFKDTCEQMSLQYCIGKMGLAPSKVDVYTFISKCEDCNDNEKQLPSFSTVSPPKLPKLKLQKDLDLKDTPNTMLQKPHPYSVWFDLSVLSNENDKYRKFLGVIKELRRELPSVLHGEKDASDRISTKIYCAKQLIWEMQNDISQTSITSHQDSLLGFKKFCDLFKTITELKTYLYDVNLLVITFRQDKKLIQSLTPYIQQTIDRLSSLPLKEERFSKSIDFDAPLNLNECLSPQEFELMKRDLWTHEITHLKD